VSEFTPVMWCPQVGQRVIDTRIGPGVVTRTYTTAQYRHRVLVAFDDPEKLSGYVHVSELRAERPGAGWLIINGGRSTTPSSTTSAATDRAA
jgi:hypothetical protein